MARIKYTGPVDPMRIPGIGPVGKDWIPCPDNIAWEFINTTGFVVELDQKIGSPVVSDSVKKIKGGDDK